MPMSNLGKFLASYISISLLQSFVSSLYKLIENDSDSLTYTENYFLHTGSVTYLLTPWSRVLLEKLTSKLCS